MDVDPSKHQVIIHKEGWLDKPPPLNKFYGYRSCKKRYFRILQMNPNNKVLLKKTPKKGSKQMTKLQEFYLVYWANEEVQKKPLRAIPIYGNEQVSKYHRYEGEDKNMILFSTDDRIYFFFAESEAEMNSWHQKLSIVISYTNGSSNTSTNIEDYVRRMTIDLAEDTIYETMDGDEEGEDTWSVNATTECSTAIMPHSVPYYHNHAIQQSHVAGSCSITPDDSVSQAGRQVNAIQAAGSNVSQKALQPKDLFHNSQAKRQMSEDTWSMLKARNKPSPPPRPRCRTDGDIIATTGDPKESDETEKRPFSVATSDIRRNDVLHITEEETCEKVLRNVQSLSSSMPPHTTHIPANDNEKTNSDNNYNLNISDRSLTLTVFNTPATLANDIPGEGFHVTYGQYEIHVKKLDR